MYSLFASGVEEKFVKTFRGLPSYGVRGTTCTCVAGFLKDRSALVAVASHSISRLGVKRKTVTKRSLDSPARSESIFKDSKRVKSFKSPRIRNKECGLHVPGTGG
jgi:hypothetical protein